VHVTRITAVLLALLLLAPTSGAADPVAADPVAADPAADEREPITTGEGSIAAHIEFTGATEIDYDGERYAYVGQFNGEFDRANVAEGQQGGLKVIDLVGDDETPALTQVGQLDCPGTDNYIRYLDPAVYSPEEGRKYVVMAHHGNLCTREALLDDGERLAGGYGAFNGIATIDVTDPTDPHIVDTTAHWSAHTVMPHPTQPYLYVLPGGTTNGTAAPGRISPTGIVDASDPTDLRYVASYQHNLTGCHDLGFTADGAFAYCAGAGEIQVWDVSGANVESPVVVGTIVNPAIMFPHNAVISPSGRYLVINDEAFGFHTCTGEAADLYGSLWIYDISIPEVPVLAGRISPPARDGVGTYTGWVESWCAAHNYNFVPGTDIVVASWFAGGMTAHDISDPLMPELIAAHQPGGRSVMWSAHYYGGYVLTGDMALGTQILDIPALREAEAQAADSGGATAAAGLGVASAATAAPRIDRTDVLIPDVLPPRPARPGAGESGFCVIPGIPRAA
jgi:hypothetical protein